MKFIPIILSPLCYGLSRLKDEDGKSCVSYVAITMDENLDLNVYTHRGRPSKTEKRRTSREMKQQLRELKENIKYKDGTEILLAVSVATDSMIGG